MGKMMDTLVQDLDKEMQTAEVDEKNAQEEYEQMMSDSSAKRAEDKKVMADKNGAKADAEEALQTHTDSKAASTKELSGTVEYIGSLHGEDDCGGVGASATMRMQTIAAKIKGWSKPRKFIRNAAQDAGAVHPSGTKPGPAAALTYPAAGVW